MFDADGDGIIDGKELEILDKKLSDDAKTQKHTRRMLSFSLVALVISVACNFGLTTFAIEKGKEVKTSGASSSGAKYLTVAGGDEPVRVDRSADKAVLSSTLPDSSFEKLQQLTIEGIEGKIGFQVLAWARYKTGNSQHGSVRMFLTPEMKGFLRSHSFASLFL